MNNFFKIFCLLLISLALSFSACEKKEKYPAIPAIEYIDFTQKPDSAYLRFSFTDGDGDIGLSQGDTLAPYDKNGDFYYNLYINYFEKRDGVFEEIDTVCTVQGCVPLDFNYRIPDITQPGKNKALNGEIKIKLSAPYKLASPNDTIKYEFYIVDRALHKSNVVSTEDIKVLY
jgi:hypothetical protein